MMNEKITHLRALLLDDGWDVERKADALKALAEIKAAWDALLAPVDVEAEVDGFVAECLRVSNMSAIDARAIARPLVTDRARLAREVERLTGEAKHFETSAQMLGADHDTAAAMRQRAERELAAARAEIARLTAAPREAWDRLRVTAEAAAQSLIAYGEAPSHEALALRAALDAIAAVEPVVDVTAITHDYRPGAQDGMPLLSDVEAREEPIDAEDLWTDYRTERPHLTASDRLAFLEGVAAARRNPTPPRALTEAEAGAVIDAWCIRYETSTIVPSEARASLARRLVARGDVPPEVRPVEPSPEQQILQAELDVSAPDRTNNEGAEKYRRREAQARLDALRAWYPTAFGETSAAAPAREMAVTTGEDAARQCVAVLATNAAGEVLLVRTKRGWELPGGGVEPGESPSGAAAREVTEETGLSLASLDTVPTEILGTEKPGAAYRSRIALYRATAEGEPKAGSDALMAMWVRPSSVLQCHGEGGLSDLDTRPALLAWARENASACNVDHTADERPRVLGGECADCLHRPPLHEPTCSKARCSLDARIEAVVKRMVRHMALK